MEPCSDAEDCFAFSASFTFSTRAWWSSRCCRCQAGLIQYTSLFYEILQWNCMNLFITCITFPRAQCLRDYPTFVATARYWTDAFARRSSLGIEEKVEYIYFSEIYKTNRLEPDACIKCWIQVQKLVEMGFPVDQVRSALQSTNGDENQALEKLCSWMPLLNQNVCLHSVHMCASTKWLNTYKFHSSFPCV